MHLPQTVQTMTELKDLAYIPYMIISQKDGVPIIGMVQDVLLGSYRISDDKVKLDAKAVSNLQMVNSMFNGNLPSNTKIYTGKEIYSMILPPNMNTKVKKFEVINSVIKVIIYFLFKIIIFGSFFGALSGEYIQKNNLKQSLKPALGTFVGIVTGTVVKFLTTTAFLGLYIYLIYTNLLS